MSADVVSGIICLELFFEGILETGGSLKQLVFGTPNWESDRVRSGGGRDLSRRATPALARGGEEGTVGGWVGRERGGGRAKGGEGTEGGQSAPEVSGSEATDRKMLACIYATVLKEISM